MRTYRSELLYHLGVTILIPPCLRAHSYLACNDNVKSFDGRVSKPASKAKQQEVGSGRCHEGTREPTYARSCGVLYDEVRASVVQTCRDATTKGHHAGEHHVPFLRGYLQSRSHSYTPKKDK